MATFKNITSVYDYSKNLERQAFWMGLMGFMKGGWGGYIVDSRIMYDYTQAIDPKTGLLKQDGQIGITNTELGFVQSSTNNTPADIYEDSYGYFGSNLITDNKDVCLLIETETLSERTIGRDYAHRVNTDTYNFSPLVSETINQVNIKYNSYLRIKKITLYAGVTNNRNAILTTDNRLNLFVRTLKFADTYTRVSTNFTDYKSIKGKDVCMSADLRRMLSYPFLLQYLRVFNPTIFGNQSNAVVGLFYNNNSTQTNLIDAGDSYDILFKGEDVLKLFLNYFNIPWTFSKYNAENVKAEDLDDGYEPYNPDPTPGGSSKPGGGKGTFDDTSDTIYIPESATSTAITSGFITVWNPTRDEIVSLSNTLWSDNIFVQGVVNFMGAGFDAIIGLHSIPFKPVITENKKMINFGNRNTFTNSYQVIEQFTNFSCGELKVEEYWGNALDYSPYTKIELFLPFIGMVTLNPDDVMNKLIRVDYKCDVVNGSCIAFISVDGSVLYTYQGNCITNIPITSQNYSQMLSAIITAGVNVSSAIASGGATALASEGLMSATSVLTTKAPIQHSGSLTGSSGLMGVRTPYLVITRPQQSIPKNYNKFKGYPSNITSQLSELSGYTEVEYIHLEGFDNATADELDKIEQALKDGVVI